jgi:hypothetical protein
MDGKKNASGYGGLASIGRFVIDIASRSCRSVVARSSAATPAAAGLIKQPRQALRRLADRQSLDRFLVGANADDLGAALDFAVEALDAVDGLDFQPVILGKLA